MTTLVRLPDQFTPGAGSAATAATPTCCCCCCCVNSVAVTSAILAEGLRADLRKETKRSPRAEVLIALGPVIAISPILAVLLGVRSLSGGGLSVAGAVAVGSALAWTLIVAAAAGARNPFRSLGRLIGGGALFVIEFVVALASGMSIEFASVVVVPLIIIGVFRYHRDDHGR